MIGQMFGPYRISEKLGEGGMGAVYRAVDEMLDRDVALKMLRPELAHRPEIVDRFRAEAVTLAKLDHPSIARIHGFSRHDDRWGIAMEFVAGETLLARLERAGRMPWAEVVPLAAQLLDALAYAHGLGVIHRDIKPANVLVRPDGRLKVTDFGIARVLGSARSTRTGHVVGTLEYMSPEQIRGETPDGRADLYAVGILLYELLTGRVPFSGTTDYDIMTQHLHAPVPPARPLAGDVPMWFDEILSRAMAKSLSERFASADELRDAIETSAASEPAVVVKTTRLAAPGTQAYRAFNPTRVAGAAAAGAGAGSAAVHAGAGPASGASARITRDRAAYVSGSAAEQAGAVHGGAASGGVGARLTGLASLPAIRAFTWRQTTAAAAIVVSLVTMSLLAWRSLAPQGVEVTTAASASGSSGTNVGDTARLRPAASEPLVGGPLPSGGGPVGPIVPAQPDVPYTQPPPAYGGGGGRVAAPSPASPRSGMPVTPAPAPAPAPREAPVAPIDGTPVAGSDDDIPPINSNRPSLGAVEFEDVVLVTTEGKKQRGRDIVLRFESNRLVLKDADSEGVLRAIPYTGITAATYARSRKPVWKTDRHSASVVRGLARSVSFLRTTKHWLTLEGPGTSLLLELDGDALEELLPAFEARADVKIARIVEK